MPHAHSSSAASSGGDDLGSTDEVKVFKDEGDGEDEKRSSENLLEEKSSLIDWTESEEKSGEPYSGKLSVKSDLSPVFGKFEPHPAASFNMGYLVTPYPYPNGGAHPLPVSMAGKMGLPAGGSLSLFCPGGDLGQPPPAHMGIPPPYQLDSKLAAGLARTPMYPFPGGTYPYPMLSPEMSQVAASWHTPSMYPISSAASGFRSPYPTSLPISSSSLSSELYRFSPTLGGGLGLGLSPALVPAPPSKVDIFTHHSRSQAEKGSGSSASDKPSEGSANNSKEQNKKPHIKKPLNAFMLYMKEMRAKVVAECTLKESAAINQILGRRWHALGREEQAKYYELARRERQLHMQLYPDWSSRANTQRGKKRKRKQETTDGGNNLKNAERGTDLTNKTSGANLAGGRRNACATWRLWRRRRATRRCPPRTPPALRRTSSWRSCRTRPATARPTPPSTRPPAPAASAPSPPSPPPPPTLPPSRATPSAPTPATPTTPSPSGSSPRRPGHGRNRGPATRPYPSRSGCVSWDVCSAVYGVTDGPRSRCDGRPTITV